MIFLLLIHALDVLNKKTDAETRIRFETGFGQLQHTTKFKKKGTDCAKRPENAPYRRKRGR